jgi:predicted transposase YdaD
MSDYYNIIDSAEKRAREEGLLQGRLEGRMEGHAEGRAEGRMEGIAEGREKGKMETMLQNAQKMKEIGIDAETIMQVTVLDFDLVSTL